QHVAWQPAGALVDRRGDGVIGGRGAGKEDPRVARLDGLALVYQANTDRLIRASLHARGRLVCGQAVAAHVELAHDAPRGVVLRRVVGTHERAVPATDALIV